MGCRVSFVPHEESWVLDTCGRVNMDSHGKPIMSPLSSGIDLLISSHRDICIIDTGRVDAYART